MILVGGLPGVLVPTEGTYGVVPVQFGTEGAFDSPLLNDLDVGDDSTELLWVAESAPTSGTFAITDHGGYSLVAADDGAYPWTYRLIEWPAGEAPTATTASVQSVVGLVADIDGAITLDDWHVVGTIRGGPEVPANPGGGGRPRRRLTTREREERTRLQREALGILPKRAQKKIVAAAKAEAAKDAPDLGLLAPVVADVAMSYGIPAGDVARAAQVTFDSMIPPIDQARRMSIDVALQKMMGERRALATQALSQLQEALRQLLH
jgi:hypothetical protein